MQRGEFLSHEPSTFTFPLLLLSSPQRRRNNVRRELQVSRILRAFINIAPFHRGKKTNIDKRYIYSTFFYLVHHSKIKNPNSTFISRSSLSFLSSFDDESSSLDEELKLNVRLIEQNRNETLVVSATKGIRILKLDQRSSQGSSSLKAGRRT